jgi:hypothetical protein
LGRTSHRCGEDPARAVGHQEQVRVHLPLVLGRDRLDRRRVVGRHRGLQLGKIGNLPGQHGVEVGHRRKLLVDDRASLLETSPELVLRRRGDPHVHQVDRDAHADQRERRAGEEDPVGER